MRDLNPVTGLVVLVFSLLGCISRNTPPPHITLPLACGSQNQPNTEVILIPGGVFGRQNLPSFYLDKVEVTAGAYNECVAADHCDAIERAGECNANRPDHPANCIRYSQARAYCAWRGSRLPTALEWAWAARGREESRRYPWGDRDASCDLAIIPVKPDEHGIAQLPGCSHYGTWPTGSRQAGATRDGVLDMVGNVMEWTEPTNRHGLGLILGGSWSYGAPNSVEEFLVWSWDHGSVDVGFRCARDIESRCR
jgi:formylglycine-generating enzyme required for sulfatase activity